MKEAEKDLEWKFHAFLLGHSLSNRALHLISWDTVCSSKDSGGLGVFSLWQRQILLLGKLAANLILQSTSLWAQLVYSKYKGAFGS